MDKQVLDYIRSLRRLGVKDGMIRSKLILAGYDPAFCDTLLVRKKDRRALYGGLAAIMVLVIALSVSYGSLIDRRQAMTGMASLGSQSSKTEVSAGADLSFALDILSDIRYMDDPGSCGLVADPYLAAMCKRMSYRPHMRTHIVNATSAWHEPPPHTSKRCRDLEAPLGIYCYYLDAAASARSDLNHSREMCHLLTDEKNIGECEFYLILNFVNMEQDTESKIPFIKGYCSAIEDDFWRAECHYLLADELTFLKDDRYLPQIAEACIEVYGPVNSCITHVGSVMSFDTLAKFCDTLGSDWKPDCYFEMGKHHNLHREDISSIGQVDLCGKVPEDFLKDCYEGYSSVARHEPWLPRYLDAEYAMAYCSLVPKEYRGYCIRGMSHYLVAYIKDTDHVVRTCEGLDDDLERECFFEWGRHMNGKDTCESLPESHRPGCDDGQEFVKTYPLQFR